MYPIKSISQTVQSIYSNIIDIVISMFIWERWKNKGVPTDVVNQHAEACNVFLTRDVPRSTLFTLAQLRYHNSVKSISPHLIQN